MSQSEARFSLDKFLTFPFRSVLFLRMLLCFNAPIAHECYVESAKLHLYYKFKGKFAAVIWFRSRVGDGLCRKTHRISGFSKLSMM